MNMVDITQIININSRKKIYEQICTTFDGIMKSNFRSYEKYKYFILKIIVDFVIKNQRNHENDYTSQQR